VEKETKTMTANNNPNNSAVTDDSLDRVRSHTSVTVNSRIDRDMAARINDYAAQPQANISHRLEELEREWDTERILELNASMLAFIGLILGVTVHQNWLWLTGVVLPFLFQHAVQGWCPPLEVIRRLGVRTRQEIDREKFALKALRGDFNKISSETDAATRAKEVLQIVGIE
jgi:hypothetical protein